MSRSMICMLVLAAAVVSELHAQKDEKLSLVTCRQSSTRTKFSACYKAIDGNYAQDFRELSCSSVSGKTNGWWSARLKKRATITAVRIINRMDCCTNQLNDFDILVDGVKCATYKSRLAFSEKTFSCKAEGQEIRIRSRMRELTLCEVEVSGKYVEAKPNGKKTTEKKSEVKNPEVKKPDEKKPVEKTPDVKTTVVKTPVKKTPDVKTTVVKTPVKKTPDVKTPDVKTPDVKMPDVKTPDVKTPDVKTPDVKMPDVKTPDVKAPNVKKLT